MASFDNAYSRFITLAKILLPLAALGLLSTLFLFSRHVDPVGNLPYSQVDVEQLAHEQRINAPNYAGVTEDGTAISVAADTARPDIATPGNAEASGLTARLDFADGSRTDITSAEGQIDNNAGKVLLHGGVTIDTSSGYHITTEALTTALNRTDVFSDSTVQATGPLGTLTAGQMQISQQGDAGYVLVFKRGVKLVYEPEE